MHLKPQIKEISVFSFQRKLWVGHISSMENTKIGTQ